MEEKYTEVTETIQVTFTQQQSDAFVDIIKTIEQQSGWPVDQVFFTQMGTTVLIYQKESERMN